MARAAARSLAPSHERRPTRPPLGLVQAQPITRRHIVASWRRALAAAAAANQAAFDIEALDVHGLDEAARRLRAEREWLEHFEQDSPARLP